MIKKSLKSFGRYLVKKIIIDIKVSENSKGERKLTFFTTKTFFGKVLNQGIKLFAKKLNLKDLEGIIYRIQKDLNPHKLYFKHTAKAFGFKIKVTGLPFSDVKKEGPIIFYANHPLSGADAFALASEIEKIRPDIKTIASTYVESIPGLRENSFVVNVFDGPDVRELNKKKFDMINKHISQGNSLLIFPAGSMSCWSDDNQVYALDPPWRVGIARIGEQSPDTVFIPVFVQGEPSDEYLNLRKKSPALASILVFKELARQKDGEIDFVVGEGISINELKDLSYQDKVDYLRASLYSLGTDYFKRSKGNDQIINENYSKEAPLVTNEEYNLMNKIRAKEALEN
ncbi:MAG: hypothetical protein ABFS32_11870 [Bacteroidota bacterium]